MASKELALQRSIAASAVLSLLGWGANQVSSGSFPSASSGMGRRSKNGGRKGSRKVPSSGPGGMNPLNSTDLKVKPLSITSVPTKIPRNISSQVVWDVVKLDGTVNSSLTGISEANFGFALSNHPQASNWTSLFDQWAIPYASIEFDSRTPPGATFSPPLIYTALDFDGMNNLGSVQAIEDYGSCEAIVLQPQVRFIRSVRPSPKMAVGSSTGTPQATVSGPVWLDCAFTNVPHYGIRSIINISPSAMAFAGTTLTIYFCFRNTL
jgi:hypothetical protein